MNFLAEAYALNRVYGKDKMFYIIGDGFAVGTTYAEYQSGKVVGRILEEFSGFLGRLAGLLSDKK